MSELSKIWPPYEVFYIEAMLFNTQSVLSSVTNLGELFQHREKDGAYINSRQILDELQNIILNAAAISRYFWPIKGGKERAEHLKKVFKIEDSNPLKDRSLRNALEHFDERLDQFTSKSIAGHIFPELICDLPEDNGITHVFRAYYTETQIVEILGEQYSIIPLIDEIERIDRHLALCSERGGRLHIIED